MPLPAMTAGVVERVDERQALGVADALHLRERLADVRRRGGRPARRSPRQASTLERTAPAGMTTVTGTPAARPAHAYACPAFPAESVMAPRPRASSDSVAIRFDMPAGLERARSSGGARP